MNDYGRFDIIITIKRQGGILSDPDPVRHGCATRRNE
jgi:hypothetical protein